MPEIIDLVDDKPSEMEATTEDPIEPSPEPKEPVSDLLKTVAAMRDSDEEDDLVREDVEAMMETCRRVAQEAASAEDEQVLGDPPVVAEVEEIVVAVDEEEPSWLERELGPWAARHRNGLRAWLLALLALYVSLFASMLLQGGVLGLSEHSTTALVRDVLWAVLMGIVVLLAIGKQY